MPNPAPSAGQMTAEAYPPMTPEELLANELSSRPAVAKVVTWSSSGDMFSLLVDGWAFATCPANEPGQIARIKHAAGCWNAAPAFGSELIAARAEIADLRRVVERLQGIVGELRTVWVKEGGEVIEVLETPQTGKKYREVFYARRYAESSLAFDLAQRAGTQEDQDAN